MGLIVVGFGLAAVVLAVYYGATLGLVTTLLALVLAAIPLGIVIPTFLWLDRFEAEPARYLVTAFLWGALVAALVAAVFNTGANIAFQSAIGREDDALLATAVFSAPLVEEASKGLLVLLIWWFRRREFDGIIDGMVYAGVVAAGFAFTENIQYLGMAYDSGGDAALTGHVHRPLPVHPVRPPDVHGAHRHRDRDRRHGPQPRAQGGRTGRRLPAGRAVARHLEPRGHHRRRGPAVGLPRRRGADLHRLRRPGRLGPSPGRAA